jgi:hypothetical protein
MHRVQWDTQILHDTTWSGGTVRHWCSHSMFVLIGDFAPRNSISRSRARTNRCYLCNHKKFRQPKLWIPIQSIHPKVRCRMSLMSSNYFNNYTVGNFSFKDQGMSIPVGRTFDFVCQGQDAQPTVQEGDEAFQPPARWRHLGCASRSSTKYGGSDSTADKRGNFWHSLHPATLRQAQTA